MVGQIGGDAHIQHGDAGAHLPRQHVDGSAARQKVQHHLRGHRGWVGADAFGSHPVIPGADDNGARMQRRIKATTDPSKLNAERF
jgi:hypothetical protein